MERARPVPIALVDTNVWWSRTLRDWICLMAIESDDEFFSLAWTEDIMAELVYRLRRKYPTKPDNQIGGVRERIASVCPNGRISGYSIDPTIEYPDQFDAHIHAAAVHAGAGYVVTDDTRGLPYTDELPYEVYTCDEFLVLVDDSSPGLKRTVIERQLEYWASRSPEGFNLVSALRRSNAPEFAERIRAELSALGCFTVDQK